jgi:signal transduction histidine kinase
MTDQASQQQAILDVALAQGHFGPGALSALTTAQAQEANNLVWFRSSATPEESLALAETMALPKAQQAQAVEQQAIAAGNGALALGPQASRQWSAGMSYTVGWMGGSKQQLAEWITADAQGLQQSAMRSATLTGGAGLGALALVLLGTIFAARSMVRRLRRLEAAALEGAGAGLPISDSAVSAGFFWRNHALLERLLQLIDSSELNEEDPERLANLFEMDHLATRIWRNADSALVLTGHETPRSAEPLALVDVLRAAVSEIEEYGRVALDVQQGVWVGGSAATDTVHLLAELLENATTFSPEATEVIVSGHAVSGGGSLISITDGGAGMSEEELTRLNRQLADPTLAGEDAAGHMGLLAVALLAARHDITVTLSMPPDGGTTAEVYLPATLISLDDELGGWQGSADEEDFAEASEEADTEVADLPFSAVRFASGPEPPLGTEPDAPEFVQQVLGAPAPSPAPGTSNGVTESEPATADPGGGSPIFESVRSGHVHAFGRDQSGRSGQQTGQSPTTQPARPPTTWGSWSSPTESDPPAAGSPASPGLAQRIPEPGRVLGAATGQETSQASATESAEITRSQLASFQRGSRRARAAVQDRSTEQQERDR